MATAQVAVLIVDDQAPFRRAARAVLAATPEFEVVGEAESGEQALELQDSLRPSIVLMDIKMPGIDGIETTRRLTGANPELVVILMSTYEADDLPPGATSCGAVGYIHKEEFGSEVIRDLWERHGRAA